MKRGEHVNGVKAREPYNAPWRKGGCHECMKREGSRAMGRRRDSMASEHGGVLWRGGGEGKGERFMDNACLDD
jgi:hypothetical protein